jgi:hypothetical protein
LTRAANGGQRHPTSGARRRWGAALLVAAALGAAWLPALEPLLRNEITCGYDNVFHLLRAVELAHLWEHGILYTRWAPNMALGFGFPLFVFAGPFSHALMALGHLIGLPWASAMNATFALGMVMGGGGVLWLMWELRREQGGDHRTWIAGGMLGAVAYVYSPFLAYDFFNRGSLWESLAWAFPPLILLGLHRWSRDRAKGYLLLGVAALVGMVLCHYPFAALFAPIFGLWTGLQAYLARDWRVLWRGALLALLGLGITAFYWGPSFLERGFVQTDRLLGTWVFDYRHNFLPLRHLLALPRRADPRLVNDWPEKSLGLVPVLVALAPLIGLRRLGREARWQIGVLWLLVIVCAALTLSPSLWLWDHLPLLPYVQFPWRFLGPAAFCLALLAGYVPAALCGHERAARLCGPVTAAMVALIVVANLGWFYPDACRTPEDLSVTGILRWERLTDTLGTTAKGEFLPIWVERFPEISLDDAYAQGAPIARLRAEDLPEGAEIVHATYGPISGSIKLATPESFTAEYMAFYYPGWQVSIDGTQVPVYPAAETGLLTFDVPAGAHQIEVRFSETSWRTASNWLSGAILLGVVGMAAVPSGWGRDLRRRQVRLGPGAQQDQRCVAFWLLGASVALAVLKIVLIDPGENLWRSSRFDDAGTVRGVAVPITANFGNRALLLGTSALPQGVSAADSPVLTLYWQALEPGGQDWRVGLTLVGPDGSRWPVGIRPARWGRPPPPMYEWGRDGYARMDELLDLPAGLAPGSYDLELALFDRATAEPVSVLSAEGNPVSPALRLGAMEIAAPLRPPSLADLGIDAQTDSASDTGPCAGPLYLLAAALDRDGAAPGDLVTVTMVWELLESTDDDLTVIATLTDEVGQVLRTWDLPPAASWWPTHVWTPGDRWQGKAELRLPGDLESGQHALSLAIGACDVAVQPLQITAPARRWEVPAEFTPAEVVFGDAIALVGYDLATTDAERGTTLPLTLAWEARREIQLAYRVFVHLVDGEGNFIAQNDGEPVGWTRPTPGWAPGEVVIDARPLWISETALPGAYDLRVGLYDDQGVRLISASGGDSVSLATVSISE